MSDPEKVKVDFSLRDSELGWMRRVDRYAMIIVPAWFNFIGWLALVGGLEFLHRKSDSKILAVIVALSVFAIWRYLLAVFARVEFVGLAPKASPMRQFLISEGICAVFTLGGWVIVQRAVDLIAKSTAT